MKLITFKDIYILGTIVAENNLYKHYHYPEMLIRYDSNFIEFKSIPSLETFQAAESYLLDYHLQRGQKHVKFYFPENQKPTEELIAYLTHSGYDIGFLELYGIQPEHFPSVETNADIDIQIVTEENMDILIDLQYKSDLEFGREFANEQVKLTKRQFKNSMMEQILAFYKGMPAGYVHLIISEDTVEIDNLTVEESFRYKGIGSNIQKYIMHSFPKKKIILVADGEDTPREMYKRQNYTYYGFKYEVERIEEDVH